MKRVDRAEDIVAQIDLAMAEAQAAFGDGRIYIERFIARGRHVEVQVLGDGDACDPSRRRATARSSGGSRSWSRKRPPLACPTTARAAIEEAAVRLARHLRYRGAGTVEFLVDAESFDFFFLEMNARIQVEHPVTEAITGIDLIEQQLLIADGQPLGITQEMIRPQGHAIEVRINAEDPARDFRPSPGIVGRADWPGGAGIARRHAHRDAAG